MVNPVDEYSCTVVMMVVVVVFVRRIRTTGEA